ncbi:polyprenyl synthetase family protein [Nocardia blacklockiae]|uniref:polyprenyl synthetase family protein n=1 Tax=Nocardia blacklockiae TaxID=480036 RepID=UPI001893E96F|nr:polyprenyl synthetase family protein [Nocardia blacklockiae]MBF6170962.1 polyprenyl synthetase family protein [Nocardia blacklockiae]
MSTAADESIRTRCGAAALGDHPGRATDVARWQAETRAGVLGELDVFLRAHRLGVVRGVALDDIARRYVTGGKCLRSTFMYVGWLCGAPPDAAALRAAAALELVHAFALLQDDVMDEATFRRAAPAGHVDFAGQHGDLDLPGDAARFGESAAVLLADICLVWADAMLRDSGIGAERLHRMWPRYDAMRVELALGQFADLLNDARAEPALDQVLAVARAKSGNYTVRRPLELGAAMAGCDESTLSALDRYGRVVGEAFQLRDDLLGVFGTEATGKPADGDLAQHKATTVVVTATQLAGPAERRELSALLAAPAVDEAAAARLRTLIAATGAPRRIEAMIGDRLAEARAATAALPAAVRDLLDGLALSCAARQV